MRTPANMVEQITAAIAGVQLEAKRIDTGTTLQVNITEAQARVLAERIAAPWKTPTTKEIHLNSRLWLKTEPIRRSDLSGLSSLPGHAVS